MANLDTAAKRKSSVSMLMPFMPPGVIPGGVAQENRQAGAWSYSGILAAVVTPIIGILRATFTGKQPGVIYTGKQPDVSFIGKQPGITFEGS